MKLIKKLFLLLLVNISVTAFAEDTTPSNPNGTGTATYDNGTGKSTYDNGTGRLYDNNTGKSTYNNNTSISAPKNVVKPIVQPKKKIQNLNTKLMLQGVLPDEADKIIQFAKDAGATDAQMEGNVLKVYGNNFNQDTFETWMVDSIPGAKVQH